MPFNPVKYLYENLDMSACEMQFSGALEQFCLDADLDVSSDSSRSLCIYELTALNSELRPLVNHLANVLIIWHRLHEQWPVYVQETRHWES